MTPLARALKEQEMTVMRLSVLTGLDSKYLYKLADGTRKNPSWTFVNIIAAALETPADILFPPPKRKRYGRR